MEEKIKIVTKSESISRKELAGIARNQYGSLVKAVIDVEKNIIAIGGELHSDEEALLLERGSKQENLWGINLYPEKTGDDFTEFDSMINLRLWQGNRTRGVDDPTIQKKVRDIVAKLIID